MVMDHIPSTTFNWHGMTSSSPMQATLFVRSVSSLHDDSDFISQHTKLSPKILRWSSHVIFKGGEVA